VVNRFVAIYLWFGLLGGHLSDETNANRVIHNSGQLISAIDVVIVGVLAHRF
jgi:hypothetical protein